MDAVTRGVFAVLLLAAFAWAGSLATPGSALAGTTGSSAAGTLRTEQDRPGATLPRAPWQRLATLAAYRPRFDEKRAGHGPDAADLRPYFVTMTASRPRLSFPPLAFAIGRLYRPFEPRAPPAA